MKPVITFSYSHMALDDLLESSWMSFHMIIAKESRLRISFIAYEIEVMLKSEVADCDSVCELPFDIV